MHKFSHAVHVPEVSHACIQCAWAHKQPTAAASWCVMASASCRIWQTPWVLKGVVTEHKSTVLCWNITPVVYSPSTLNLSPLFSEC